MKERMYSRVAGSIVVCAALVLLVCVDAPAQSVPSKGNNRGVVYSTKHNEVPAASVDQDAMQALHLRQALEVDNKEWKAQPQEAVVPPEAVAALKSALSLKEKELDISGQSLEATSKQMDDIRFELELKNKALMASNRAAEQAKIELESFKKSQKEKAAIFKSLEQKKDAADRSKDLAATARLAETANVKELDARKRNLSSKIRETEKLQKELASLKASLEAKNKDLQELKRSKKITERQLAALSRVNKQKEAVEKEKEALSKDNDKLREEKVGLKVELLKLKSAGNKDKEVSALKKERDQMSSHIASLEVTAKKEKAKMHFDLGTAYTQARIFDQAIDEYEKSLQYDPTNAQAHYDLGLLYAHARNDAKNSLLHLKKYLEYSPTAENREEVEYLMKVIQR